MCSLHTWGECPQNAFHLLATGALKTYGMQGKIDYMEKTKSPYFVEDNSRGWNYLTIGDWGWGPTFDPTAWYPKKRVSVAVPGMKFNSDFRIAWGERIATQGVQHNVGSHMKIDPLHYNSATKAGLGGESSGDKFAGNKIDFIINVGDSFYERSDRGRATWKKAWREVYGDFEELGVDADNTGVTAFDTDSRLFGSKYFTNAGFKWYSTFGNHDWNEDCHGYWQNQIDYKILDRRSQVGQLKISEKVNVNSEHNSSSSLFGGSCCSFGSNCCCGSSESYSPES